MPNILSLENILHGFSLTITSTISSVVVDKDSCCVVITYVTLLAMLYVYKPVWLAVNRKETKLHNLVTYVLVLL